MKLITHDVGDDYEHFGVHSPRTRRAVYVADDSGRMIADFAIRNLNQPISAHPEEVERAKRFIDAEAAIAAAVQAEREANCAAVCGICAGKFPDYGKAELISGLWEHRITEAGICYKVQPCDAAAIRARNGAK